MSLRTASSYDVRSYEAGIHHRRAASSSALSLVRTRTFARPPSPATPPPPPAADHRFSSLFPSFLGSPYLTTSELPRLDADVDFNAQDGRIPSPAPTADFSIIDAEADDSDANPFIPGSYPPSTPRLISSLAFSRGRQLAGENLSRSTLFNPHRRDRPPSPSQNSSNSLKSLLPRLLEVLSSPSRTILSFSPAITSNSSSSSRSSSRATSPSASPRRRPNQTWYTNNPSPTGRHSPAYRASGSFSKYKGKAKVTGLFTGRNGTTSRKELCEHINYSELPPLDGEEGELIDDEACFVDVRAVTGMGSFFCSSCLNAYVIISTLDILSMLPPELGIHVLSLMGHSSPQTPYSRLTAFYLSNPISPGRSSGIFGEVDTDHHEALNALLMCRLVSRTWCRLASDNAVWQSLFLNRWGIDLGIASDPRFRTESFMRNIRSTLGATWDHDMTGIKDKAKRVLGISSPSIGLPIWSAPLQLDWRILYRERLELESRWAGSPCLPVDESKLSSKQGFSIFGGVSSSDDAPIHRKPYEPEPMRIAGHSDR